MPPDIFIAGMNIPGKLPYKTYFKPLENPRIAWLCIRYLLIAIETLLVIVSLALALDSLAADADCTSNPPIFVKIVAQSLQCLLRAMIKPWIALKERSHGVNDPQRI